jgi:hypothetical protein
VVRNECTSPLVGTEQGCQKTFVFCFGLFDSFFELFSTFSSFLNENPKISRNVKEEEVVVVVVDEEEENGQIVPSFLNETAALEPKHSLQLTHSVSCSSPLPPCFSTPASLTTCPSFPLCSTTSLPATDRPKRSLRHLLTRRVSSFEGQLPPKRASAPRAARHRPHLTHSQLLGVSKLASSVVSTSSCRSIGSINWHIRRHRPP